jgi:hypothetical protein
MESLLHYVWKHRLFDEASLRTTDGRPFEVIDTGMSNTNAGPDFFNAKIRIDDKLWVGNVEIHQLASDWYRHRHETDKAYDSVILHVSATVDREPVCDSSGRAIPQWQMAIPASVSENYRYLLESDAAVPCLSRIGEIPEIYLTDWKSALLTERLERKANDIFRLLAEKEDDWNEALYITLARNFGFGVNNDAFELLARSLPLKIIHKHSSSLFQVEALLLGQAGLLDNDVSIDNYYGSLRNEYMFLREKYSLKPLESHLFKSLRIRPNNFPHVKLAQLAGLICRSQGMFAELTEIDDDRRIRRFFLSDVSDYWRTHYRFGVASPGKDKRLGMSALLILLINVAAPIYFAFGKRKGSSEFIDKALRLLESIGPENNYVVNPFIRAGIHAINSADTQAIIQLKREYCEKKKCIFCRIGHKLLAGKIETEEQ